MQNAYKKEKLNEVYILKFNSIHVNSTKQMYQFFSLHRLRLYAFYIKLFEEQYAADNARICVRPYGLEITIYVGSAN